jgi:hypothetical protein
LKLVCGLIEISTTGTPFGQIESLRLVFDRDFCREGVV